MKLTTITTPKRLKRDNTYAEYTNDQLCLAFNSYVVEGKSPEIVQREIIYRQNQVFEKSDHSELPEQELDAVRKNIRDGAKDTTQLWANALELVHTAYELAQVQRPDITMEGAWKQYEEMISLAVKELAKSRGIDGDWRRTSLSEAKVKNEDLEEFSIEADVDGLPAVVKRKAASINDIVQPFYDHNVTGCDIEIKHRSLNHIVLYFCNEDGRTGDKVVIRKTSQ